MPEDTLNSREELVSCDVEVLPKAIAGFLKQHRFRKSVLYEIWKNLRAREIPDSILINCVRLVLDSTVASFSNPALKFTSDEKLDLVELNIYMLRFLRCKEVPPEDFLSIFRGLNKILTMPRKEGHAAVLRALSLQCLRQPDLNFDDCVVQEIALWHVWYTGRSDDLIKWCEAVDKDRKPLSCDLLKSWTSTLSCSDGRFACTFIGPLLKYTSSRNVDVFDALSNIELESPLKVTLRVLSQRRVIDAFAVAETYTFQREFVAILSLICAYYVGVITEERKKNLWCLAELSFSILKCYVRVEGCKVDNIALLLRHVFYNRGLLSPEKMGQLCEMTASLGEVLPLSKRDHSLWGQEPISKFANSMVTVIRDCKDSRTATKIADTYMKIMFLRMSTAPSSKDSFQLFRYALSLLETALFFEADQKRPIVAISPPIIFEFLKLYGPNNVDPTVLTACVSSIRLQGAFLCSCIDPSDPDAPKWLALEVYALLRLNADEETISYVKNRFMSFANDEVHRAVMVVMDLRLKAQCKSEIEDPSSKAEDNALIESARMGITFGLKHMKLSGAVVAELEEAKAIMKELPTNDHESVEQMERAALNTDLPIALRTLCHGNLFDLFKSIRGMIDNYKIFKNMPYWVLLSTFVLDDMRTAAAYFAVNGDYTNQFKILACLDLLLHSVNAPMTQIVENELRIIEALLFTGCVENARALLEKVESRMAELQMYSEDFFYLETKIERFRIFLCIEENTPSPPDNLDVLIASVRASTLEKLRLYALQRYYHGKALDRWNLNKTGHLVSIDCFESCSRNCQTIFLYLKSKNYTMTNWEHLELFYLLLKSDSLRSEVSLDRLTIYNTISIISGKYTESQRALSVYFMLDDLERLSRVTLRLESSLDSKMSVISALIDPNRTDWFIKWLPESINSEESYAIRDVDSIPYNTAVHLKMKQHQIDVAKRRVPAKEFLKFSKLRTHKNGCKCHLCLSLGFELMFKRIDAVTSGITKQQFVPLETSVFDRLGSGLRGIAKVFNVQVHPETRCDMVLRQIRILHAFHLAEGYASDGSFNESLEILDALEKLELSPKDALELAVRKFEYTYQIDWQVALNAMGIYSNAPVEMMPPPFSGEEFKTPAVVRRRDVKNVQPRRRIRLPFVDNESSGSSDEDAPEKKIPKKAEKEKEEIVPEAGETIRPKRTCVVRAQKAASGHESVESTKPMFIPMEDAANVTTRRKKKKLNLPRSESASKKVGSPDDLFDDDGEMSFVQTFSKMSFKDRLKKPKGMDQCNANEEFRKLIEAAQGCTLQSNQCLVTDLFQCLAFLSAYRKQRLESIFYLERSLGIGVQIAALNRGSKMGEFFGEKLLASDYFKILRPTVKFDPQWHKGIWDWCDKDWLIVQLSSIMEGGTTPGLLAVRYEYGHDPTIVHLSAKHDAQFQGSLFKHFDDINLLNKITMDNKSTDHWDKRFNADKLLTEFCKSLENSWMGCWKGLFRAAISGPEKGIIDRVVKRVNEFAESQNLLPDQRMLHIGLQGLDILQIDQLTAMLVKTLGARTSADINRVHEFAQSLISTEERAALAKARRKPMILILDKYLINVPIDSCPIFSQVEQTRMPSVPFTVAHAQLMSERRIDKGNPFTLVDPLDGFYVVNAADNLPGCQQRYVAQMKSLIDLWQGKVGAPLDRESFRKYLQSKSVYLYAGHGTGRQHMKDFIEHLNIRAVVLLFGCSSAKMRRIGSKMDSEGYALRVLFGGSPAVLGNLWDVTDLDTDLLAHAMLRMWLHKIFPDVTHREPQLGAAVNKSRRVCKLKALNGAAPVVFGLPCTSFPI